MSVPYGAPQQQPGPAQPAVGVNLNVILPLVAAGLALIAFLLAFADDVPSSGGIEFLYAAGILAGLSVLPKAPRLLWAAVPLALIPTLQLLQGLIKTEADVQGMQIVLLIVALLETAAIVVSLLLEAGILKFSPKPANPYGRQQPPGGWNPQSGAFQQQHGQQPQGQYGPPSGQFGAPGQPQPQQPQPGQPQPTSYLSQPGQFGQPPQQPPGTPPGGFGGSQQG